MFKFVESADEYLKPKLINICGHIIPKYICQFGFEVGAENSFKGVLERWEKFDQFCRFKFCPDEDLHKVTVGEFENYLERHFGKKPDSGERTDGSDSKDEDKVKLLVVNDIHIQKDYQIGSRVDCGTPSNCCNVSSGLAKKGEKAAGYWGTRNGECDIPNRTFEASMKYIGGRIFAFNVLNY